MNKILNSYNQFSKVAGIHLIFDRNGELIINACRITISNGKLDFEKKLEGIRNINDLAKHFDPGTIVAVNISGRGVLQKMIETVEAVTESGFAAILPNAKFSDFYLQQFVSGEKSFISLCRTREADKWLTAIRSIKLVPLSLSFGVFPIANILDQLNHYGLEIVVDQYRITLNEHGHWLSCQQENAEITDFPLKIESEKINHNLLVPYAIAFQLALRKSVDSIIAPIFNLEIELLKTVARRKLKIFGSMLLALFFLILLINFSLFSWLTSKNDYLAAQLNLSSQQIDNMGRLQEKIMKSENLLRDLGWDSGIVKSALIDQLASILPRNVTWTSIEVNPINADRGMEKKGLTFRSRSIRIRGFAERIIDLNEWIVKAGNKRWVKKIQLLNYDFDSERGAGEFVVLINF